MSGDGEAGPAVDLGSKGITPRTPSSRLRAAFKSGLKQKESLIPVLSDREFKALNTLRARGEEAALFETKGGADHMLVRCLAARGWSADDAFPLAESYFTILQPAVNPESLVARDVLAELKSGVLTLTGGRDKAGAAVLIYSGQKYDPKQMSPLQMLKCALYLVHNALSSEETLRHGIVFVMSWLNGTNEERQLRDLLLTTFHARYPALIQKCLIISRGFVDRTSLTLSMAFARTELRQKLKVIKASELQNFVTLSQLTSQFGGGTLMYDHQNFIRARMSEEGNHDVDKSCGPRMVTSKEKVLLFSNADLYRARAAVQRCKAYTSTKHGARSLPAPKETPAKKPHGTEEGAASPKVFESPTSLMTPPATPEEVGREGRRAIVDPPLPSLAHTHTHTHTHTPAGRSTASPADRP